MEIVWSNNVIWNSPESNMNETNGYGYATDQILQALRRQGHEIFFHKEDADVQIWFDQPHHWEWHDNVYKIGYLPWESTKLKDGWREIMNQVDEIWTPSPVIADWFREDGINVPIYVFEHGVDKIWTPQKRNLSDENVKFLHCGGEAARKRADRTMQAFRSAFPDRNDVKLTMKMVSPGWNVPFVGKIHILNQVLTESQLVDLFHDHHIYVYPSYGEGFGLTPIQAMATGMPTITVPAWAPYKEFLDPNLSIPATLGVSPWQKIHPGKMFRPDFDILVDIMKYAADNYDKIQEFAQAQVPGIQEKYDWDSLTKEAFASLQSRL